MIQFRSVVHVFRKEVREGTRDRNLLISVVVMPLFLYPVLGFGIFQVLQILQGISERATTVLAVSEQVPSAVADSLRALPHHEIVPLPDAITDDSFDATRYRDWRQGALRREETVPDALLLWRVDGAGVDSATIVHDASRDRSSTARDRIVGIVEDWRRVRAERALEGVGLGERDLDLWSVEQENTASATQKGQELLSAVLPLILLLMLTMGTFAAVLDTVVGERERGTLETLLVSPLRKGEVLVGKYLFVVTSSLVAFLLNLGSMSLFLGFVLRLLDAGGEVRVGIDLVQFSLIMAAALLTAALLSALLMVLAITARTYREGQATLNPFYLLTMVPGLVVISSREPFGLSHALVPILNSTALFKSALRGEFPLLPFVVTYVVLGACTVATLAFAARLATREDVLLEPRVGLRKLLTGRSGGKS